MRTQVKKLHSLPLREAAFIEVMECLAVPKIPDSPDWIYEVKLDGYRALAVSTHGTLNLFSRRRNSFNRQYPLVYEALGDLPENTVVDGEIVALDDEGKPNFSLLQHYASQASHIHYFIFDLLVYQNHDLTRLPLIERREIMGTALHLRSPKIRIAESFETSVEEMLKAVRELGLEGVVAKKKQSFYESGKRAGSWIKYRLNCGQEFAIGWCSKRFVRSRCRSARSPISPKRTDPIAISVGNNIRDSSALRVSVKNACLVGRKQAANIPFTQMSKLERFSRSARLSDVVSLVAATTTSSLPFSLSIYANTRSRSPAFETLP